MGITCKPTGKFRSVMRKMENELEKQKKLAKEKKDSKGKRKNEKSK